MRKRIYQVIELSTGEDTPSRIYDIMLFVSILFSLIPMMFRRSSPIFTYLEWITTLIFIIDYLLRLWTADLKLPRLKKAAFLVYPFTPMAIIDLLSILPTLLLMQPKFRLFVMLRLMRAIDVRQAVRDALGDTAYSFEDALETALERLEKSHAQKHSSSGDN